MLIEYLIRSVHDPSFIPLSKWIIVIRHRGAPNDEKKIKGSKVTKVDRRGIYYESVEGEIFIPFRRIIRLELS